MTSWMSKGFVCLIGLAAAARGATPPIPQFTGTYSVKNVVPLPGASARVPDPPNPGEIAMPPDSRTQVNLHIDLTVTNPFDNDLVKTAIELQDTQFPGRKHTTFNLIFKKKGQATANIDLQMPEPEYQSWSQGSSPNFFITFTDQQGRLIRQKVWLTPDPAKKGGN